MSGERPWTDRLINGLLLAAAAVVTLKVSLWAVGALWGLVQLLLFTVLPLVAVGWVVVKLWRALHPEDDLQPE